MVLQIEQTGTSWNPCPENHKTDSCLCDDSQTDGPAQVIIVAVGALMGHIRIRQCSLI